MAIVTVPRPLQEQLGEAATDSLVGMFEQFQEAQIQQQETYKELHFELLEQRFLRHVAESERRLRAEMQAGFDRQQEQLARQQEQLTAQQEQIAVLGKEIGVVRSDLTKEIGAVRSDLGNQIGVVQSDLTKEIGAVRSDLGNQIGAVHADVNRQIADVHKQIARQTRWILTVLGGAAVLFPIIQRVMAVLLP